MTRQTMPTTAAATALVMAVLLCLVGLCLGASVAEGGATDGGQQFYRVARTPDGAPLPQASYDVSRTFAVPGLPSSFDARIAWPHCARPILNQADCGSCWAFAASEALSVRTCIYTDQNVTLSPQFLLSCNDRLKCEMGELPEFAWDFLIKTGIPSLACVPYVSGDGHVPACPSTCTAGTGRMTLYRAKNASHVGSFIDPTRHIAEIKAALLRGPLDATFNVFEAFMGYEDGVYDKCHLTDAGRYLGMHSVKVVGWYDDYQGQGPAWIVQNSWGESFGMQGFFLMRAGVDCCGFESLLFEGFPASPPLFP